MKKSFKPKPLKLTRETIIHLTSDTLTFAVGGRDRETNSVCVTDCMDNCPIQTQGCPG